MKNRKWLLFILVISATVFISCKKYLDKQSDNSFVVPGLTYRPCWMMRM
ncbi:hypothetical protein [Ginsengibacter hankyongi]|nr:hypothetical protein [Ginsengibacter hankyongi]